MRPFELKRQKLIAWFDVANLRFCSVRPEDLAVRQKASFVMNDDSSRNECPTRTDEQIIGRPFCFNPPDRPNPGRIEFSVVRQVNHVSCMENPCNAVFARATITGCSGVTSSFPRTVEISR